MSTPKTRLRQEFEFPHKPNWKYLRCQLENLMVSENWGREKVQIYLLADLKSSQREEENKYKTLNPKITVYYEGSRIKKQEKKSKRPKLKNKRLDA